MSAAVALPLEEGYGLLERIDLPKTTVFYRDSDHSYWKDAKPNKKADGGWSGSGRLTGVSTVIGPWDFRPDSLMKWVERLTLEGVSRGFGWRDTGNNTFGPPRKVPTDPYALRQILDALELRWENIRDESSDRGTFAHEHTFHALATGAPVPSLADVPDAERGFHQGVLKWWSWRNPQPEYAEQVVCSPTHGVAGRLDFLGRIKDPVRPGLGIVDLKTTTSSFVPNKHLVQPAGYDLLAVESGLIEEPVEWYMVLQVDEDGNFREIWSPATHADFLMALAMYRRSAELSKAAKP